MMNALAANDDDDGDVDDGRTTVLPPGIVESRNNIIIDDDDDPKGNTLASDNNMRASCHQSGGDGGERMGAGGGGWTTIVANMAHEEYRSYFTVWMFLTRLPSPSRIDLNPEYLMRGMSYFPLVGSFLGTCCSILHDALVGSFGLPSSISSIFVVIFGLCLTGCFHEDGLADTLDGMGGWSRSQVLKIMSDSRVGTYGCASLCLYLLVKVHLLSHIGSISSSSRWSYMDSSGFGPAIFAGQTLSRMSAPFLIRTREYAAEHGPKSPYYHRMIDAKRSLSWPRVSFAMAYSYASMVALYGPIYATVLASSVLCASHLAGNRGDYLLGGVMGDYLGCTICMCEILILTLIASRDAMYETTTTIFDAMVRSGSSFATEGDGGGGASGRDDGLASDCIRDIVLRMSTLYGIDRVRPLVNLALLMTALKIWCIFVGPPDMYDKEEERKGEDEGKED
jgi:adenosylcobinamide-GDP ribazoletransferase